MLRGRAALSCSQLLSVGIGKEKLILPGAPGRGTWMLLISNQHELLQQQPKPLYLQHVRLSDFFKSCKCTGSLTKRQISFQSCLVLGGH